MAQLKLQNSDQKIVLSTQSEVIYEWAQRDVQARRQTS